VAGAEIPPPEDWRAKVEEELTALRSEVERIKSSLGM
jgi:hypothetical protein